MLPMPVDDSHSFPGEPVRGICQQPDLRLIPPFLTDSMSTSKVHALSKVTNCIFNQSFEKLISKKPYGSSDAIHWVSINFANTSGRCPDALTLIPPPPPFSKKCVLNFYKETPLKKPTCNNATITTYRYIMIKTMCVTIDIHLNVKFGANFKQHLSFFQSHMEMWRIVGINHFPVRSRGF